ncbi:T-cell surface glycoprotein CD1b-like [Lontra canadensis]|uniref:T-cell surface glycoprotein CD1b-like n=1 Tax=Lontra canadensis TaxID=76717 RepID=UPI0013F3A1B2|nr:T-cell surface glycoprotein CD1b-like [Lontra canadensis]
MSWTLLLFRPWVPFLWIFPVFVLSSSPASPFLLTFVTLPFPTAFQGPTSYQVIQISSFINSSWAQSQGSGWVGDVQIHGWDSAADRAVFLKSWSKGNFSDEEVAELEELIQVYLSGFVLEVQDHASEFQMQYPFEIQGIAGCQLHPGGGTESFLRGALGGLDFASLKNYSCVPAPEGGSRAQRICELTSQYKGIRDIGEKLLFETCPRYLLGVLDAGKTELQRKVKPEAWLSAGPRPGPGRLLLVCHVSGFYPKPVWVMWMRGEQEQQGTQRDDVLPHADGTWYLRVTLDVAAREAAGLSCQVRHSSLGGQDMVLYWGNPISVVLISLAIIVPLLILLIGLPCGFLRRWSYQSIS